MKKQPNRNIIVTLDIIDPATGQKVNMELSHEEYAAAQAAANAQGCSVKDSALNAANEERLERWRRQNVIKFRPNVEVTFVRLGCNRTD